MSPFILPTILALARAHVTGAALPGRNLAGHYPACCGDTPPHGRRGGHKATEVVKDDLH